MVSAIIEVKSNTGNEKVKMKVFSDKPLSESQMEYLRSLKRDEAMKIGTLHGWKVIDISSWEYSQVALQTF